MRPPAWLGAAAGLPTRDCAAAGRACRPGVCHGRRDWRGGGAVAGGRTEAASVARGEALPDVGSDLATRTGG